MASTFARGIGGECLLSSLAAFSYSGASFLQCPHLPGKPLCQGPVPAPTQPPSDTGFLYNSHTSAAEGAELGPPT